MKLLLTILLFPCIVCLAKASEEESTLPPVEEAEACPPEEGFMLCQDPDDSSNFQCLPNEMCEELTKGEDRADTVFPRE